MAWYLHVGDNLRKQPSWREFSTNQKPYPDLGSDASSLWNFCVRSPGVISRETVDVVEKCWLFSRAALAENYLWLKLKLAKAVGDDARVREGEETGKRFWSCLLSPARVLPGRSAASLLWSLSEGLTISRPFAELWKTRRSALILG